MEGTMSFVGDAIGDVVGGITGAKQAGEAAQAAGLTQAQAATGGIAETRRQFDAIVELMSPFVTAGTGAIGQQQAITGLAGPQAQQQALTGIEQSPLFQSLTEQGERAILQRASATGGLRGGNIQQSLSQFRPQLLNQLVEQQYGRLAGLTGVGQAAAAGQAAAGQAAGSDIASLIAQRGAATAGGQIGAGQTMASTFKDILGIGGIVAGGF